MVTNIETQGRTTDNTGVNTLLDTLKSKGMKDQAVVAHLDSLNNDPNELARLSLQEGLLNRIISLDPATNPNIDPQQAEELKLYLQAARHIEMDQIKEIKEYFGKIKLPKPAKKPKTFSRRAFTGGVVTGLAAYILAPRAINALITPSEESGDEPTIPAPTEPEPASSPTSTLSPKAANTPTTVPPQAKSTATAPPLEAKPTLSTPAKPTSSPSPAQPSPLPAVPTPKPPDATATKAPTKEPEKIFNVVNELMQPFVVEALKRREQRMREDPEYARRVDSDLNKDRINFFVFSYGETYEPPVTDKVMIGSYSLISYNLKTGSIEQVSLTRDIRAPEIERYHHKTRGEKIGPTKIYQAYWTGGFNLMREVLENATGLSGDFSIAMSDSVVKNLIESVLGTITVDVPKDFKTMEFYQEGVKQPGGSFNKGPQKMDSLTAMRFMKALPIEYDPKIERHFRKQLVTKGLLESLSSGLGNPLVWLNGINFLRNQRTTDNTKADFDINELGAKNLERIFKIVGSGLSGILTGSKVNLGFPKSDKTIFVVDPAIGDGGVQWVENSSGSVYKDELKKGVYPDKAVEVPINGNPYAKDLVKDYWGSVRKLVKERLTGVKQGGKKALLSKEFKQESVLYPAELSYQQTKEWIGNIRNSHDEVLTESLFLKEIAGLPEDKQDEILKAIANAHADALIKHYGDTQAIIGLDPGHGGLDVGAAAQTANGKTILEKDINWKVAQMVAKGLDEKTAGRYKVIILRPENPSYELRENNSIIIAEAIQKRKALLLKMERELRTNPADLGKNIAYISIHFNGSQDPTQQGIETYSSNNLGMSDETHRQNSKALAQTLHQEIKAAILRSGYQVKDRRVQEDPDLQEPKGNTDPSQGPFLVLGSPKLDRDLSR